MTKVVHLTTSLGYGGTERQLLELVRHLPPTFDQELFCFRPTGAFLPAFVRHGLPPRALCLGRSLGAPKTGAATVSFALSLRRLRADVLHCHDNYAAVVGVAAARLARVPVIASRRDLCHDLSPLRKLAVAAALHQATLVLANAFSVAAQTELTFRLSPARLVVVPNGIDLATFDAAVSEKTPPKTRSFSVLMVARMVHEAKGHVDLLRTAASVLSHVTDVEFLIVGDGPLEAHVKATAKTLGVQNHVRFLGARNDVPALMRSVDIVCHPARSEGFPNAVLEGMAAAKPVVATAIGGVPELMIDGEHGVLAAPGDIAKLAAGILRLRADEALRLRMGRAARAHVEHEFTAKRLGQRVARIYEKLTE